jgi:kynurenine formamidase
VDGTGTVLGIDKWAAHGIAGRGVLLDVAGMLASEGQPIDPGATFVITPEMLDRTAQHQGLQFAMADILLVRTGWVGWYEALSSDRQRDIEVMRCSPGLEASQRTARWLWDHRIAAAAADNMALESQPFRPGFPVDSLHAWLLAAFGMPIGELFALDELAAQCARRRHWSFCLTASPFNFPGGVGSPGNALAIL